MATEKHSIPITAIIENEGQFLFVKRNRNAKNMAGKWVFPGGKVEVGEDVIQALYRELEEDTHMNFYDDIALLSSYKFVRNEDLSSSVGIVFLVRAIDRNFASDGSIEDFRWISPEEIADFKFSYKEIKDFDEETNVTIPGMEVHVRNAIVAIKQNLFMNRHMLSVTEYQQKNCSMSKEYLVGLMNANDVNEYLRDNLFPNKRN